MRCDEPLLRRLMTAAQKGDHSAYDALLRQCQCWLRAYFHYRIAPAMVDDLIQESLISLHRKRATWDSARPFLPWLAAIARYRWIDALRRQRKTAELHEGDAIIEADDVAIHARLSLDQLLSYLPTKQAQAITLVKINGASIAEAASICGQSESLIKVNIHRGLKRLTQLVESAD